MKLSEVPFKWVVPEVGFRPEPGEVRFDADDTDWWDVKYLVIPAGNSRSYQPLKEHPALYRTFAEADSEAKILQFANSYGALGLAREMPWSSVKLDFDPDYDVDSVVTAEFGTDWESEITAMAKCITVWQGLVANEPQAMGRVFVSGDVIREFQPDPWKIAPSLSDVARGVAYVWHAVRQRVEHFEPRVVHTETRKGEDSLEVVVAPKNLLGALWLQLADAVRTNPHHVKCRTCDRWFEVAPRARRGSVVYCSPKCRTAAYRLEQRARELAKEGMAEKDIATQIGRNQAFVTEALVEEGSRTR